MTRIGLFSDSHGDHQALAQLLENMGYIDAACFMGDVARDAEFLRLALAAMPNHPQFFAVRGNNDYITTLPDDLLIELGGKRIWMEHGHRISSIMALAYRAMEHQAEIALFGHTHVPYCEYVNGVLVINPGSAGNYCRGGAARASLLIIDDRGLFRVDDVNL